MSDSVSVNVSKIKQWIADNSDSQNIREELKALGHDDESINIYIKEFKKAKYGKRQSYAFVCLAVGSLLGFISCLLAIFNPIPELYYLFLYGISSVSAVIIFTGLYLLFE